MVKSHIGEKKKRRRKAAFVFVFVFVFGRGGLIIDESVVLVVLLLLLDGFYWITGFYYCYLVPIIDKILICDFMFLGFLIPVAASWPSWSFCIPNGRFNGNQYIEFWLLWAFGCLGEQGLHKGGNLGICEFVNRG